MDGVEQHKKIGSLFYLSFEDKVIYLNKYKLDYKRLRDELEIIRNKDILNKNSLIFINSILEYEDEKNGRWSTGLYGDDFEYLVDSKNNIINNENTKDFTEIFQIISNFIILINTDKVRHITSNFSNYLILDGVCIDSEGNSVVLGDTIYYMYDNIIRNGIVKNITRSNWGTYVELYSGDSVQSYQCYIKKKDLITVIAGGMARDIERTTHRLTELQKNLDSLLTIHSENLEEN